MESDRNYGEGSLPPADMYAGAVSDGLDLDPSPGIDQRRILEPPGLVDQRERLDGIRPRFVISETLERFQKSVFYQKHEAHSIFKGINSGADSSHVYVAPR